MKSITAEELEKFIPHPTYRSDEEIAMIRAAVAGSPLGRHVLTEQKYAILHYLATHPLNEMEDTVGGAVLMVFVCGIETGMAIQAGREEALGRLTQ